MMNRGYLLLLCLATITLSSGCSMMAPRYTASIDSVQKIKDADTQPVKVGEFESIPGNGNANPISIRLRPNQLHAQTTIRRLTRSLIPKQNRRPAIRRHQHV